MDSRVGRRYLHGIAISLVVLGASSAGVGKGSVIRLSVIRLSAVQPRLVEGGVAGVHEFVASGVGIRGARPGNGSGYRCQGNDGAGVSGCYGNHAIGVVRRRRESAASKATFPRNGGPGKKQRRLRVGAMGAENARWE